MEKIHIIYAVITGFFGVLSAFLGYLSTKISSDKRSIEDTLRLKESRIIRLEQTVEKKILEHDKKISGRDTVISQNNETISKRDETIKKLEKWIEGVSTSHKEYLDIVVLGPRQVGKTSVIKSWFQPWFNVSSSSPTQSWQEHTIYLKSYNDGKFLDTDLNIERIRRKSLNLRIRDYAGEDEYRMKAFNYIKKLDNNIVIVLFIAPSFNVLNSNSDKHDSYYSASVLKELESHIIKSNCNIKGVALVFNKIDLLPSNIRRAELENICLRQYANIIERINSIFGGVVSIYFTSATENTGVGNLLRDVCWTIMDEDGEKKDIAEFLGGD